MNTNDWIINALGFLILLGAGLLLLWAMSRIGNKN